MIVTLNQPDKATRLAILRSWCCVHVLVSGVGTVWFSKTRADLETQVMGTRGGLPVVSADGIISLWWFGELWAIPSVGNTRVNLEMIHS